MSDTKPPESNANDPRLKRKPQVVKWRRVPAKRPTSKHRFDVVPCEIETYELHRAQLEDGTVKEIIVRCVRSFRGTENYEPTEPPEEVLKELGVQ